MTVVLGLKYDGGSIIASDSLALGYDGYRKVEIADKYKKKVFMINGKYGFTFSGDSYFGNQIKKRLEKFDDVPEKQELEKLVLEEYNDLKDKFEIGTKPEEEQKLFEQSFSSVIVVGNAQRVVAITEQGDDAQECKYFICAGLGGVLVEDSLKDYYDSKGKLPSEKEALDLCMSSVERASACPLVGEVPEIILLRDNGKSIDLSDKALEKYKTLVKNAKSEVYQEVLSCSSN